MYYPPDFPARVSILKAGSMLNFTVQYYTYDIQRNTYDGFQVD